jgi:hypothetical protein
MNIIRNRSLKIATITSLLLPLAFVLVTCATQVCVSASAQTQQQDGDRVVAAKKFRLSQGSEVQLKLTASAPATSWRTQGAEAAVLTCMIDGKYDQDIILFMGADKFTYESLLGNLSAGDHKLELVLNNKQSSTRATSVKIDKVEVEPTKGLDDLNALAFAHAPLLFARPNSVGHYTDIPLLMWYETFKNDDQTTTIRYSYVFTNEDAGTATEALMARWGRATDIEWAYEIKLRGSDTVQEAFQAVNHMSTPFHGKMLGTHPVLIVASDNNNFSDTGESAMRFRLWPELMDLSSHSREELMDRHPWTYKVMAQELYREGKISEAGGHQIRDPRDYIYLEAKAPRPNLGIDFKVQMQDGKWIEADLGREDLRITRQGWFRVAIRLPQDENPAQAQRIALDCHLPGHAEKVTDCSQVTVQKIFMLSGDYAPSALNIKVEGAVNTADSGSRQ